MKLIASLLLLVTVISLSHRADANCRNLKCMLKEGRLITSRHILSWNYRTCAFPSLTCSRANDRVASRCNKDIKRDIALRTRICQTRGYFLPVWPQSHTIYVTEMGKADCKSNDANNFWMDKDRNGVPMAQPVCCTLYASTPGGKAVPTQFAC